MCRSIGSERQHTLFMHDIVHRQQCDWIAGDAIAYVYAFCFGDAKVGVRRGKFREGVQRLEERDHGGDEIYYHARDDGDLFRRCEVYRSYKILGKASYPTHLQRTYSNKRWYTRRGQDRISIDIPFETLNCLAGARRTRIASWRLRYPPFISTLERPRSDYKPISKQPLHSDFLFSLTIQDTR